MLYVVTVSLCMIVKNEEACLERCLKSVNALVDEINIVDTGSTDNTKTIARKYTERIYDFPWRDDFAAARNESFSKATKDYILWLDADDVLLAEDQQKFAQLKKDLSPNIDAVSMQYNLAFNENGTVAYSVRRNRLVKRRKGFKWYGAVHEFLAIGGNILESDVAVTHQPGKKEISDRNLRIYEKRLARGEAFTPRDLFYYANECRDHGHYKTAIEYYKKFLETEQGWREDCITACGNIADAYLALADEKNAVQYILHSFEYDTPRAENCCRLGYIFLRRNELDNAIFWYDLATKLDVEKIRKKGGFVNHDCYTWVPHLQLCVCYDRLGRYEMAKYHNDKAKMYIPQHPSVLHNEKYLLERMK
jgi:glycosyltransferase involved in cell wall biosynthesis